MNAYAGNVQCGSLLHITEAYDKGFSGEAGGSNIGITGMQLQITEIKQFRYVQLVEKAATVPYNNHTNHTYYTNGGRYGYHGSAGA